MTSFEDVAALFESLGFGVVYKTPSAIVGEKRAGPTDIFGHRIITEHLYAYSKDENTEWVVTHSNMPYSGERAQVFSGSLEQFKVIAPLLK